MIKVMDIGFGRTGTLSLKHALEQLGFAKCYHFSDMYDDPDAPARWLAFSEGQPMDWEKVFAGCQATVYWSPSYDYETLLAQYPDIKVVLSVRDPEKWYASMYNTVYRYNRMTFFREWFLRIFGMVKPELKTLYRLWHLQEQTLWRKVFQGRFHDQPYAIDIFNRHIAEVKQKVPPERLLVFNVKDGWEPLCAFLDVPVPSTPFPHVNDTSSFVTWREGVFKNIFFGDRRA